MDVVEVLVRRLVQVGIAERYGRWEIASQIFEYGDSYSVSNKDLRMARRTARLEKELAKPREKNPFPTVEKDNWGKGN